MEVIQWGCILLMLPLFSVSYNDFLNFHSEGDTSNYEQSLIKTPRFVKDMNWNDDATYVCKYSDEDHNVIKNTTAATK